MANVHFSVSKRRVIASTLIVSLLFSLTACKKNTGKKEFESGKEILETDPFFDAQVNELKIPLDPDKKVSFKIVQNYSYIAGYAVATYYVDYEMPEEKGPEVYEKLRLINGVDSVPVVFMTGVKDLSKIFGVMSSDPQGCIFKPIDNGVLTGTIEYFVG